MTAWSALPIRVDRVGDRYTMVLLGHDDPDGLRGKLSKGVRGDEQRSAVSREVDLAVHGCRAAVHWAWALLWFRAICSGECVIASRSRRAVRTPLGLSDINVIFLGVSRVAKGVLRH